MEEELDSLNVKEGNKNWPKYEEVEPEIF